MKFGNHFRITNFLIPDLVIVKSVSGLQRVTIVCICAWNVGGCCHQPWSVCLLHGYRDIVSQICAC